MIEAWNFMWQRPDGLRNEVVRRKQDHYDHAFAWRFLQQGMLAAEADVAEYVKYLVDWNMMLERKVMLCNT